MRNGEKSILSIFCFVCRIFSLFVKFKMQKNVVKSKLMMKIYKYNIPQKKNLEKRDMKKITTKNRVLFY